LRLFRGDAGLTGLAELDEDIGESDMDRVTRLTESASRLAFARVVTPPPREDAAEVEWTMPEDIVLERRRDLL